MKDKFLRNLLNGTAEEARINVTVIVKGKTPITNIATVTSDARELNTANGTAVCVPQRKVTISRWLSRNFQTHLLYR